MHFFRTVLWLVSLLSLVACGGGSGGGSTKSITSEDESNEVYQQSTLPSIQNSTIPDVLISKNTENSTKTNTFSKEDTKSNGFLILQERVGYFYFRQMEMNMNLSYVDSVWSQIERLCEGKTVCLISKDKITFVYTRELYNRDMQLILNYEKKSGDKLSFKDLKESLGEQIDEKFLLGESQLTILDESDYNYELKVDISNITVDDDNLTIVTRWNDAKSLYEIREELLNGYNGDRSMCDERTGSLIYTGFDYNKTLEILNSSFEYGYDADCVSTSSTFEGDVKEVFKQKHNRLFNLSEQSDRIKLTEHISSRIISEEYHTPLDYYLEGEVTESGGFVIANNTEGFYIHETFDIDGNIDNQISCVGDESRDLDDCTVKGEELIKSIVTKSFYKVGWFDNAPLNVVATYSAVFFNEDNTLDAYINCSTFKSDYVLSNSGIIFSNIEEESNSSLTCLDDSYEKNFKNFLEKGYEFSDNGYVVWNGLSAELDAVDDKEKFNKNDFILKLRENRYVDSYTMSNLFKVHSIRIGGFTNLSENRFYFLSTEPSMKIENEKIYFDLIDATFVADIKVLNNDVIEFENIIKVDKIDFTYLVRNCTNEAGSNECLDGDENLQYEDNEFADVIENFLNSSVSVSNGGSPESGSLWFHNETLSFNGSYI